MSAAAVGPVTVVRGFTPRRPEFGEPALILLFQLLSRENTIQNDTSMVFGKIEFPESSGFVFTAMEKPRRACIPEL